MKKQDALHIAASLQTQSFFFFFFCLSSTGMRARFDLHRYHEGLLQRCLARLHTPLACAARGTNQVLRYCQFLSPRIPAQSSSLAIRVPVSADTEKMTVWPWGWSGLMFRTETLWNLTSSDLRAFLRTRLCQPKECTKHVFETCFFTVFHNWSKHAWSKMISALGRLNEYSRPCKLQLLP